MENSCKHPYWIPVSKNPIVVLGGACVVVCRKFTLKNKLTSRSYRWCVCSVTYSVDGAPVCPGERARAGEEHVAATPTFVKLQPYTTDFLDVSHHKDCECLATKSFGSLFFLQALWVNI